MVYLIAGLVLLSCAPAFFIQGRSIKWIVALAGGCLVLGAVGVSWPSLMPSNLLAEHPALADTPLQPMAATVLGGFLFLFGLGLFLALGCRVIYTYFRVLK